MPTMEGSVQRYWGEDEVASENRKEVEKKRLAELLLSAQRRKERKEKPTSDGEVKPKKKSKSLDSKEALAEETHRKKKKKEIPQVKEEICDENELQTEERPKKKKKAKRHEESASDSPIVQVKEEIIENGDMEDATRRKKRKRRRSIPEPEEEKPKKKKKHQRHEEPKTSTLEQDEQEKKKTKGRKKDLDETAEECTKQVKKHAEKDKKIDSTEHTTDDNENNNEVKGKKNMKQAKLTGEPDKANGKKGPNAQKMYREVGGFTIIGQVNQQAKEKVKRVLPDWLANPSIVSVDLKGDQLPVVDMKGLSEGLAKKLNENGIAYFFPVQRQVIPWLLDSMSAPFFRPHDVCVSAPTGSGKTLAYVLPIVNALHTRVVPRIRALVVLPVQELAAQVYQVFRTFCSNSSLVPALLSPAQPFKTEQNNLLRQTPGDHLESKVDILVATPGRLVDHLNRTEGLDLRALRFLVMDEADRVMDGVSDWMALLEKRAGMAAGGGRTITAGSSPQTGLQKLLFSATLSQNPEKLQELNLFQPKLFTAVGLPKLEDYKPDAKQSAAPSGEYIGRYTMPTELRELMCVCNPSIKPLLLHHLATFRSWRRLLVFTNSADSAHRLATLLALMGLKTRELSSRANSARRERNKRDFVSGKASVLVSTDAMARGMDFPDVDCVISYDMPFHLRTYVHRAGRTARGGKEGTSIIILSKQEVAPLKRMLKEAGMAKIKPLPVKGKALEVQEAKYHEALRKLQELMTEEANSKKEKTKKQLKLGRTGSKPSWTVTNGTDHADV